MGSGWGGGDLEGHKQLIPSQKGGDSKDPKKRREGRREKRGGQTESEEEVRASDRAWMWNTEL